MKLNIKRIFSLVLVLVMLASSFPIVHSEGRTAALDNDDYIYVRVDQPVDGGIYCMITEQFGYHHAVSNVHMADDDGLIPAFVTVAGDYVVSNVNDAILWQFNGNAEDGYIIKSVENNEYLAKLNFTLTTNPSERQYWEHIIHENEDSSIGSEPVIHNISKSGYILFRVNGEEQYFDCFNEYQQCNIRLYERRERPVDFVPVTGVTIGTTEETVLLGSTYSFNAHVLPENATVQTVNYVSSNPTVAVVDENGLLITGSEGTTVITASDGAGVFSDSCIVTVVSEYSSIPTLTGYKVYPGKAIVSFRADDVSSFDIVDAQEGLSALTAMCYIDGFFYGFTRSEEDGYDLVKINAETYERETTTVRSGYYVRDMTYDAVTGQIFCLMATNETIYSLYFGIYTIDPITLHFDLVNDTSRYLSTLECTTDGRLYGIDMFGYLCSVDKQTAECTIIGSTTVTSINHEQTMCFCPTNGKMYWMKQDDQGGAFFEVNLATANLTYIGYPGGDAIGYEAIAGLCYVPSDDTPQFMPGDVDMDGQITIADSLMVLRHAMQLLTLSQEQLELADFNGDGSVNVVDAVEILRSAMGI